MPSPCWLRRAGASAGASSVRCMITRPMDLPTLPEHDPAAALRNAAASARPILADLELHPDLRALADSVLAGCLELTPGTQPSPRFADVIHGACAVLDEDEVPWSIEGPNGDAELIVGNIASAARAWVDSGDWLTGLSAMRGSLRSLHERHG